jgi:hypothetical protein
MSNHRKRLETPYPALHAIGSGIAVKTSEHDGGEAVAFFASVVFVNYGGKKKWNGSSQKRQ